MTNEEFAEAHAEHAGVRTRMLQIIGLLLILSAIAESILQPGK